MFAVYPVVLWVLAGVLTETWEGVADAGRNQLFALVLCCVVGGLLLMRGGLWLLYACVRPLKDYEKEELELLPT